MNPLALDHDENTVRLHLFRIVSDQNEVRLVITVGRRQCNTHVQKVTLDSLQLVSRQLLQQ